MPYSEHHGSVEEELLPQASHSDGLFPTNNAAVYYKLEEATRTTTYAASIAPLSRKKDGHSVFVSLVLQYAGDDTW